MNSELQKKSQSNIIFVLFWQNNSTAGIYLLFELLMNISIVMQL